MNLTSSDIARITGSQLIGRGKLIISELATDSRQISFVENLAFIAIRGKNHDGHQYIDTLYNKGVKIFIVSSIPADNEKYPEAAFILTKDTTEALQKLAVYKRDMFKSTVIAITGSAGKTIVKEWLSDVVGRTASVVRSPKSFNSQIGVPLSVWKLDVKFRFGIFEAGISLPGEMEKLQKIINPDICIITNIGDAHSENFRDNETKAREKLKLFRNSSMIIYCRDHPIIRRLILNDGNLMNKKMVDWSFYDRDASVFFDKKQLTGVRTGLEAFYEGVSHSFEIPFTDRASVDNAATVAASCLALGIEPELIRKGLAELVPVAMRMELKTGINNCQLIEDFYNSDPGSLYMALEFLKSQNNRKSTLILSDFVQNGRNEEELYGEVAELVRKTGIDKFIGIGQALKRNSRFFGSEARFFFTTDEFIHNFSSTQFVNEVILLKAARIFEFEKIGKLLEQQIHITVLEINLDAISHNLNEFRRLLDPGTRIMAMVKAFAYGAGPAEIAGLLEYHRAGYLAVAYTDEGIELRNAGVTLPIMVMNPDPSSASMMIKYNLEPEIYSMSSLESFADAATRNGISQYPVHIKIDTGMHRLGFMPWETDRLAEMIKKLDCLRIVSVFSHLSGSEDPSLDEFTHRQVRVFLEAVSKIREKVDYPFLRHILNTSGIVRFPQYQFDMVRPGIGIYGIGNYEKINLRPAGRFKTRISQVKKVPAGEPVGYGCVDRSDAERIIAILPVGYADGLNRKLGNRNGNIFIKGEKIPLIGNICMDMCMADITGSDIIEGDEAEIFGLNISINELAEKCDTIPYEILTNIQGRVKRVFLRE